MAINKTTGKRCAMYITAAKTITEELIAEGILEKPIFRKPRQNYEITLMVSLNKHCIRVSSMMSDKLAQESLWTPSFIDAEVWKKAVSKFQGGVTLKENVEKHLLPKMTEYLQSIPDTKFAPVIKTLLMERGIVNSPIRQKSGKTYYFNENNIYSLDSESQLFRYEKQIGKQLVEIHSENYFNMNIWYKATTHFVVGMTLDECIEIFLETEMVYKTPQEPTAFDRLVQSIAPPIYEHLPENKSRATFDRIRVIVGLSRYQFHSWENLRNEVEKYRHEIYRKVLQKVEKDRRFKKYGIPVNFLKIDSATLLRDFSIEIVLELKIREDLP